MRASQDLEKGGAIVGRDDSPVLFFSSRLSDVHYAGSRKLEVQAGEQRRIRERVASVCGRVLLEEGATADLDEIGSRGGAILCEQCESPSHVIDIASV
jgi:hypothetical protein